MNKKIVAIYSICKNESHNIDNFLETTKFADRVIVTDTGSTDDTVERLLKGGVEVHTAKIDPWRFDTARNIALSNVPSDVDYCLSLDMDETLNKNWREELDLMLEENVDLIDITLSDKRSDSTSYRSRVHRRNGWHWVRPIHEICVPNFDGTYDKISTKNIIIYHDQENPNNYIDHLDQLISNEPEYADYYIQRGSDHLEQKNYELALKDYYHYLKLTNTEDNNLVKNSRCFAYISIAQALRKLDRDLQDILDALLKSVAEDKSSREAWTYLADLWFAIGNYPQAYAASMTALSITESNNIKMNVVWGDYPRKIASQSLAKILERINNS